MKRDKKGFLKNRIKDFYTGRERYDINSLQGEDWDFSLEEDEDEDEEGHLQSPEEQL
ncbi:MAG: hypothetical protein KGJ95_01230 [Candidatus Omnitrophica bacterium]|nr:hypothetical protein [Candidatus Omnitrophota bacterium]